MKEIDVSSRSGTETIATIQRSHACLYSSDERNVMVCWIAKVVSEITVEIIRLESLYLSTSDIVPLEGTKPIPQSSEATPTDTVTHRR